MDRFEFTDENIKKLDSSTITSSEFISLLFDQFADDPLGLGEMEAKIGARAKEIGCRGDFERMLKIKQRQDREANKKNNPVMEKKYLVSAFALADGSVIYPTTGAWACTDAKGVWRLNDWGEEVIASYYPIIMTRKFVDIDTGKEDVELTWHKDNVVRSMQVPRSVISSNTRIVSLSDWGVPVTSITANNLISYLTDYEAQNQQLIQRMNSTKKFGWVKGTKKFLPFAKDFDVALNTSQIDPRIVRAVSRHGTFADGENGWLDEYDRMRNSGRTDFNFIIAASLASVLVPILNINPFMVCLYGRSGGGKTVALLFAASIWGNPDGLKMESNSTPNSIVKQLGTLNNLPAFIDDLSKSGSDQQKLTDLIYTICSGQEKARLNRNSDMRDAATWSNVTITNMERPLSASDMNGGAMNRVIDVEMMEGDMFPNGNATCRIIRANYGFLGRYFVSHVINHWDEVRPLFDDFEAQITDKALKDGNQKEQKQIQPMAAVMTADKMLADCMGNGTKPALDLDWCVGLLKNVEDVSEMQRAYNTVMDEFSINYNRFHPNSNGDYPAGCWGTEEPDTIYITSTVLEQWAKNHNFSRNQFAQWLAKKGMLIREGKNMTIKKTLPNGTRPRCYAILKSETNTNNNESELSGFESYSQQELPFNEPAFNDVPEDIPF